MLIGNMLVFDFMCGLIDNEFGLMDNKVGIAGCAALGSALQASCNKKLITLRLAHLEWSKREQEFQADLASGSAANSLKKGTKNCKFKRTPSKTAARSGR